MKPCYFIAEIGVNHEGSLERAKQMVIDAKAAGANCVKFQTYKAERLAAKNSPAYWDRSSEPTSSQYKLFKKFDTFTLADYRELFKLCKNEGIEFLTTPFDLTAVEEMDEFLNKFKIASADITNKPLLEAIARKEKPVIISTGASTKEEISQALEILTTNGCTDVTLLHCVLNYPTPIASAHMAMMKDLIENYPSCAMGYSDHTLPNYPFVALMQSLMLGGTVIEKHFTYDKSLVGNDHYHAFDKHDLIKFRKLEADYCMAWGNINEKKPTPHEDDAIAHARRSIYSNHDINEGQIITEADLIMKRPGNGISPMFINDIIGKTATRFIPEDHQFSLADVYDDKK